MDCCCCADVSTIFNVGVLLFHWTTAPHPKFLMRAPRNLSIRMHVLSGTVEILAWSLSWFWGVDSNMGVRTTLTQIQVVASFVHAGTAAYQTPIVFGTQAVMVPAYVLCVAAKIWCGVDLWLNTACLRKSVRLYNVLSIYTWCRVFIGLFGRTLMFQDSLYSVSILFAGAVCLPSLGVGAMGAAFLAIAIYQIEEDTDDEEDDSDSSDVPQLSVTGVDQCSICKDQFGEMEEDGKLIYELSRRHAFCADCIEEWSQSANSSNECPDCRRRFAGLRTCASATVGTIHREQRSKQQRAATSGSKSKYLRVLDGVRD